MRYGKHDPQDTKSPVRARWQEFEASYASSLALAVLLRDVTELGLLQDLRGLFQFAVDNADYPPTDKEPEFGEIDFESEIDASSILGPGFEKITVDEALLLHSQLFPEGFTDDEIVQRIRGLSVAGFQAALETYFKGVSGKEVRGSFVSLNLRPWLANRVPSVTLDSVHYEALIELDATRRIVIHHSGIVTESYVREVAACELRVGERRSISTQRMLRLASAAYKAANLIHREDSKPD